MKSCSLKAIKFLITVLGICGILLSSVAFAGKPEIVLFYASWHAKTTEARIAYTQAADDLSIKFREIDIDRSQSMQKAKKIGVDIPSVLPFIYILNKKGEIVFKKSYKNLSPGNIRQEIQKYLN